MREKLEQLMKTKIIRQSIVVLIAIVIFVLGMFIGRWFGGGFAVQHKPNAAAIEANPQREGIEQIDLNTATAEQLAELPGIGPKIAKDIVKYREENGPFESVWSIIDVKGIGEHKREEIVPYLKLGK